ncbi:MAG: Xaa-Pro peptidase family protein [Clostridiales bacterium]|jgi:Xaa-Pro aminopeptidase/Xaa-Pro dipeptidase|nr:Xaa-Pro peptidase family protein [Clostridiales bacterium]
MDKKTRRRRVGALRAYLADKGLDAALLTSYENRRYFSGFTGGNGYLAVTAGSVALVTDRRYITQARQQTEGDAEIVEHAADRLDVVADTLRKLRPPGNARLCGVAMESGITAGEYFALQKRLPGVKLALEEDWFLELRMVKDPEEIECIRAAVRCAEAGFELLLPKLCIGMTEKDLADELHYLVARQGAEAMSFGTIAASGPRGAMAHGAPTDRKIQNGEMVVVDFGVMKEGYCSDITRTLLFGDVPPRQMEIFRLVRKSQEAAIAAIRPGVSAAEVEEAHRRVFRAEGLEDYALKGLGHGIGLQIHEYPRVVIDSQVRLEQNMVFTVEPGLYFPGEFGVRTEDDVLVTAEGAEPLSRLPWEIHAG